MTQSGEGYEVRHSFSLTYNTKWRQWQHHTDRTKLSQSYSHMVGASTDEETKVYIPRNKIQSGWIYFLVYHKLNTIRQSGFHAEVSHLWEDLGEHFKHNTKVLWQSQTSSLPLHRKLTLLAHTMTYVAQQYPFFPWKSGFLYAAVVCFFYLHEVFQFSTKTLWFSNRGGEWHRPRICLI